MKRQQRVIVSLTLCGTIAFAGLMAAGLVGLGLSDRITSVTATAEHVGVSQ